MQKTQSGGDGFGIEGDLRKAGIAAGFCEAFKPQFIALGISAFKQHRVAKMDIAQGFGQCLLQSLANMQQHRRNQRHQPKRPVKYHQPLDCSIAQQAFDASKQSTRHATINISLTINIHAGDLGT